jgi:hypothetical protein
MMMIILLTVRILPKDRTDDDDEEAEAYGDLSTLEEEVLCGVLSKLERLGGDDENSVSPTNSCKPVTPFSQVPMGERPDGWDYG